MLKAHAMAHYGGNHSAVAAALSITRSAVSQWGQVVPLTSALRLERATDGHLKIDWSLYERGHPAAKRKAAA